MKNVLVAEHLLSAIERESTILRRSDFKLFTAKTAEEAFELHRTEGMDLIIVDIDMPKMGGDALCALVRKHRRFGRVYFLVVCSGKKSDLQRCEECGANTFATSPAEVAERISKAFDIPMRKGWRVLVKVSVHGTFRHEPFFCTSRDVSVSGILLETEKSLARGDVITCSFFLPDSERIDAVGRIMRIGGDGQPNLFGVQFTELSEPSKRIIEDFVEKRKQAAQQS